MIAGLDALADIEELLLPHATTRARPMLGAVDLGSFPQVTYVQPLGGKLSLP